MRKITFGGANSLDNFFARKDGSVDWLRWGKEVNEISTEFWKTIDTVLMGRRTYEVASAMGGDPNVKNYVFSRTLTKLPTKKVELVKEDAAGFIRKLKQQKGKDICVLGGAIFAKSLFEVDLIDEVGFNIHPVLLGSGVPLFYEMERQIDLELISCQQLKNECVVVRYRVKH